MPLIVRLSLVRMSTTSEMIPGLPLTYAAPTDGAPCA